MVERHGKSMDNKTRRDVGFPYIADESVQAEMMENGRRIQEYNQMDVTDMAGKSELLHRILGKVGENICVLQPFHCDYGTHISVGDNFFANYNCVILDVAHVEIGNNVFLAPNVAIYTAGHPIHPEARNSMYEYGIPVTIGNNVWIGGNSVILPSVTIGDNVVIGAGSVVTKDIPANVIAAGNPCKVIRKITEEDKRYYYKKQEFDAESWNKINGE